MIELKGIIIESDSTNVINFLRKCRDDNFWSLEPNYSTELAFLCSFHQAEFQNVIDSVSVFGKPTCISASIAWSPRRGENQQSSFVLGFNSDLPQFNSCKIWEFEEAHQRWLPVAELALHADTDDRVHAVAWAPNIGRPFEIIAVASCKGIAIWHVWLNSETDGRLSTEKVVLLSGHDSEIWQLEWDVSGMTLASTGGDGIVRLWQSNLNGVWQEQTALDCSGGQR